MSYFPVIQKEKKSAHKPEGAGTLLQLPRSPPPVIADAKAGDVKEPQQKIFL